MTEWITRIEYKELYFDSSTIDDFWLKGQSRVSPFQQIDFLRKFKNDQLPINKRTKEVVMDMMLIEQMSNSTLRGKTGWSITNGTDNGWFVGYLETTDNVIYFATNIEADEGFNMKNFSSIRKKITLEALNLK